MLNSGEVIIFPTDTVYGIGCSAFDVLAQKRIYEIKKRPKNKRLSILCASLEDIKKIAIVDIDAEKIIKRFMPGALTLILNTQPSLIGEAIFETVGVRIPNHPVALKLLNEHGPLATTSVNFSGFEPLNDYDSIIKEFGDLVDAVYPNNNIVSNVSSTVIDLTKKPYQVLRYGEISLDEILNYLHK